MRAPPVLLRIRVRLRDELLLKSGPVDSARLEWFEGGRIDAGLGQTRKRPNEQIRGWKRGSSFLLILCD